MATFIDGSQQAWTVQLDGLLLAELKERAGVDIVQDGLYFLEEREDLLAKALLVLCQEEKNERGLTDRQFARLISGEVSEKAIAAIRGAAEVFFRQSRWSEIQSRYKTRKDLETQYQQLRPLLETINRPDMPAAMREAVMETITSQIEGATASLTSAPVNPSASGPVANQLNAAGGSPGS